MNYKEDLTIFFKNFYTTSNREKIWFEEDLEPNIETKKMTIVGVSASSMSFAEWFDIDPHSGFPLAFEHDWKKIGMYEIPIDELMNDAFDAFVEMVFTQLLIHVHNGHDIYVGYDLLFEKNTEYDMLVGADLS